MLRINFLYLKYKYKIYELHICVYQSSHYFTIVSKKSNDYLLNNIIFFEKIFFSVVACQRYLCPYVIPMTMNAFIFGNLSLKTVLLNHRSK